MTNEKIEEKYGDEMNKIIIMSYQNGHPARGQEIIDFHERIGLTPKICRPVWKKLEAELFKNGLISHIESPV